MRSSFLHLQQVGVVYWLAARNVHCVIFSVCTTAVIHTWQWNCYLFFSAKSHTLYHADRHLNRMSKDRRYIDTMEQTHTMKNSESQISQYLRLVCLPDVGNTDGDVIISNRNFDCDQVDIFTQTSYLHQLLSCHPACIHFVWCKWPKSWHSPYN